MTAPAPAPARPGPVRPAEGPVGSGAGSSRPVSGDPVEAWRRWRLPLAIALLILLGGILIALLQPGTASTGYLDPGSTQPSGTRALADLLAQRGQSVIRAASPASAEAAAQGDPAVTLVITSPGLLSTRQLNGLARVRGRLVLVEPDGPSLAALAPGAGVAGQALSSPTGPGCTLVSARLAGRADMGGVLLRGAPGAWRCYPVDGHPSLLRYAARGRPVTLLGTGTPLTNEDLGHLGDAALALNLLRGSSRIVWLVPSLPPAAPPASASGQRSLLSLIPEPAYLVTMELAIAVLLAAVWRMRRLGPLVAEPLPVIVRASETVEGHGRLYRSRRSRDRVATVLRAAALDRMTARLALPRAAGPDAVCSALAARTGREDGEIRALLFGPVPRSDTALVSLAHDIDTLEGQVRTP